MKKLSPREAECVNLRLQGYSTSLVAEQMGVDSGTVAVLLHRARKKGHTTDPDGEIEVRPSGRRKGTTIGKKEVATPKLRSPVRTSDGRLGRVSSVKGHNAVVQFGADGPFEKYSVKSLKILSERDIMGTFLEGTG